MEDPFREDATIGELYGPAMVLEDQAAADVYFGFLVNHQMKWCKSREAAEKLTRANLAYFAGYHDNETRLRVERLFKCAHPFFGSIAENGPPTQKEALEIGYKLGLKSKGE